MADSSTALLGAKLLDNIHHGFIDKIVASLHHVQGYASSLLYFLIVIELVIFGLMWALKGDNAFGALIIKVIKIGLFISIIKYFPYILDVIINGFLFVGAKVIPGHGHETFQSGYFLDPGKVWELGFQSSASMLKLAVDYGTFNMGMSFIYLILGFGTLLLFAAIGAQIILVVTLFYITSLVVLLLAPFGVLKPVEDFFYRSLRALIQSGVRVFAVMIIGLVAYTLWKTLKLSSVSASTDLEKPLAMFFTTFVFMILFYKIPSILADAVGKISGNLFQSEGASEGQSVVVSPQASPAMAPAVAQVSAATSISGGATSVSVGAGGVASAANVNVSGGSSAGGTPQAASVTVSGMGSSTGAFGGGGKSKSTGKAASVNQSISNKTLSKLKKSV